MYISNNTVPHKLLLTFVGTLNVIIARFQFLTLVLKIRVFWNVMVCHLVFLSIVRHHSASPAGSAGPRITGMWKYKVYRYLGVEGESIVEMMCTRWDLHKKAGLGVQVLSFRWYLHVLLTPPSPAQLSCKPIPAVIPLSPPAQPYLLITLSLLHPRGI
jgi:hypothetical protein